DASPAAELPQPHPGSELAPGTEEIKTVSESGVGAWLLGQSEAAHQVSVTRIGAKRVQRGRANGRQQLVVAVRIGLLQILECLVALSAKRGCGGLQCRAIRALQRHG